MAGRKFVEAIAQIAKQFLPFENVDNIGLILGDESVGETSPVVGTFAIKRRYGAASEKRSDFDDSFGAGSRFRRQFSDGRFAAIPSRERTFDNFDASSRRTQ